MIGLSRIVIMYVKNEKLKDWSDDAPGRRPPLQSSIQIAGTGVLCRAGCGLEGMQMPVPLDLFLQSRVFRVIQLLITERGLAMFTHSQQFSRSLVFDQALS